VKRVAQNRRTEESLHAAVQIAVRMAVARYQGAQTRQDVSEVKQVARPNHWISGKRKFQDQEPSAVFEHAVYFTQCRGNIMHVPNAKSDCGRIETIVLKRHMDRIAGQQHKRVRQPALRQLATSQSQHGGGNVHADAPLSATMFLGDRDQHIPCACGNIQYARGGTFRHTPRQDAPPGHVAPG